MTLSFCTCAIPLSFFLSYFLSLLLVCCQVKNASQRKQVETAVSTAVSLPGRTNATTLPQHFVDEALLLSDILDLNEFSSVDLLIAGEQQQPRYPGWSRGLVAVILYHDGRRVFLQCLDALVQARQGRNWQVGVSEELSALATAFTDGLIKVLRSTCTCILCLLSPCLVPSIECTCDLESMHVDLWDFP